jgi:hypothetical protein
MFLCAATIVVEIGGALDVLTSDDIYRLTIEIDCALDHSTDHEEVMIDLVALGGSLTMAGKAVPTKMAELDTLASARSTSVVVGGTEASNDFAVGGEIVLPDTQTGLDAIHWNLQTRVMWIQPRSASSQVLARMNSVAHISLVKVLSCTITVMQLTLLKLGMRFVVHPTESLLKGLFSEGSDLKLPTIIDQYSELRDADKRDDLVVSRRYRCRQ